MTEPVTEAAPEPAETVTPEQGTAIVATPGHFAEWMEEHLAPHLAQYRSDAADATIKAASTTEAAKQQNDVLKEVAAVLAEVVREGPLALRAAAALEEAVKVGELLAAL